jgi:hypothetical protein
MRFENHILNENLIDMTKKTLKRMSFSQMKKFLQKEFDTFVETVQEAGLEKQVVPIINKHFDTRYRSLDDIRRQKLRENKEPFAPEMVNEDLAHWWETVKSEAFPTLAFYPALTVWLELDKLFQGQDIDMKKTIVYSLFWILLVSGKYVKGWLDWKKQNPEEHATERAQGKGGIV